MGDYDGPLHRLHCQHMIHAAQAAIARILLAREMIQHTKAIS